MAPCRRYNITGDILNEQVLSHYRDALVAIAEKGFYPTLAESAEPYLEACWHNFDADRETWDPVYAFRPGVAFRQRLARRQFHWLMRSA